jgi:DNA-binding LacI/PurR family transcriptional regulator
VGLVSGIETARFLSNPFYAGIFAGIEAELRDHHYALMFASVAPASGVPDEHIPKFLVENRVDGSLVVGAVEPPVLEYLMEADAPFVMVDYHLPNVGMDTVVTDNRRGGRVLTEHLIELGHREIAFVGGQPLDHGNFGERLQGYREALAHAGIPYREACVQGGALVGGYESIQKVLERVPGITAVVACNDANALAAMSALRDRGLKIPGDVSVAGYDDIPAASESSPPLTTMKVDRKAMGRKAAQRLVAKLKHEQAGPPHETAFPSELVVRESTGSAPAS